MKAFQCGFCGAQVYFDNSDCMHCGAQLAFVPDEMAFMAFEITSQGCKRLGRDDPAENSVRAWQPCVHRTSPWHCNWAAHASEPSGQCASCQLTRVDLSAPQCEHAVRWQVAEAAKRRVLTTLLTLGVPISPKQHVGDAVGLEFVWAAPGGATPATTGHANGTITLNLLEADDDHREVTRVAFGEPARTVVGHLRHELSHRLQQSYSIHPATQEAARELFGDERSDYGVALQTHYAGGPPPNWQQQYISAYASAHPWEDWAETCAHYLLMVDAVETAAAWGLRLDAQPELHSGSALAAMAVPVEDLVFTRWLPVARFLNAMARSIGVRDNYPFVIAPPVLEKLRFVQHVLQQATQIGGGTLPALNALGPQEQTWTFETC